MGDPGRASIPGSGRYAPLRADRKNGIAGRAAGAVSGMSIDNHLRVGAAWDTRITDEIESCWRTLLQLFFRRADA